MILIITNIVYNLYLDWSDPIWSYYNPRVPNFQPKPTWPDLIWILTDTNWTYNNPTRPDYTQPNMNPIRH